MDHSKLTFILDWDEGLLSLGELYELHNSKKVSNQSYSRLLEFSLLCQFQVASSVFKSLRVSIGGVMEMVKSLRLFSVRSLYLRSRHPLIPG